MFVLLLHMELAIFAIVAKTPYGSVEIIAEINKQIKTWKETKENE